MEKPERIFSVGHGLDNYENHILLSEVAYVYAFWEYKNEVEHWHAEITLKSGQMRKVAFNKVGYEQFMEEWKKIVEEPFSEVADVRTGG